MSAVGAEKSGSCHAAFDHTLITPQGFNGGFFGLLEPRINYLRLESDCLGRREAVSIPVSATIKAQGLGQSSEQILR
jgi:hypothetical protein